MQINFNTVMEELKKMRPEPTQFDKIKEMHDQIQLVIWQIEDLSQQSVYNNDAYADEIHDLLYAAEKIQNLIGDELKNVVEGIDTHDNV